MNRSFRYCSASYQSLRHNPQHQLAMHHALLLYRSNTIYSFIPKNACSTLRLTLAMENGFIQDESDFNWIHNNNDAFGASISALATAAYTFVVLRCPFARIASAFLDKIVGHTPDAWQMYDTIRRHREISDFTFDFFVRQLAAPAIRNSNIHWRPQIDFLVYNEYDDYFCLEQFGVAIETLRRKIGLSVVDARKLTSHGLDKYEVIADGRSFTHASALDIMNLKAAGKCPSPASLYSPELVAIVRNCYQQDIDLYLRQFGADNLLFAPPPTPAATAQPAENAACVVPRMSESGCCNICGAQPSNVGNGACSNCGALAIHRMERRLMQMLPTGFLSWRCGLHLGTGNGVSEKALHSLQTMPASDATFAELAKDAARSFDFIVVGKEISQIADKPAAFAQLLRLLSSDGILQMVLDPATANAHDLPQYFQFAEKELTVLPVKVSDPCSSETGISYLYFKNPDLAKKIRNWQQVWSA